MKSRKSMRIVSSLEVSYERTGLILWNSSVFCSFLFKMSSSKKRPRPSIIDSCPILEMAGQESERKK